MEYPIFTDPQVQAAYQGIAQAGIQTPWLHTIKNGLNGGELSPTVNCRFDLPRYQLGCEYLLNMIPLATGGISKRPGLRHVASLGTEGGSNMQHSRLLPFIYSTSIQFMFIIRYSFRYGKCSLLWVDRDGSMEEPLTLCVLPYKDNEIFELSYVQCGKVLYLAHHNHPPLKVTIGLTDGGLPFAQREQINFRIRTPTPAISEITANVYWGIEGIKTDNFYRATAVNPETGEESLPSAEASVFLIPARGREYYLIIHIDPLPEIREYRIYKKQGGMYGFIGRITEPDANGEWVFNDYNITPDTADPPPEDPENCFEKPGDYPSLVFIHQQRLGWAASDNDPLTLWLSQTSNFECRAAKSPPNDDDAIEATLASTEANAILWAVPDRSGLAIGTEGAEWYLTGAGGENAITPNSLSFQAQTTYGSEPLIPPLRAGSSLIFCQRGGHQARDMGYSFQSDRYEAQDITLLAHHLFRFAQIKNWTWQADPDCIIWLVTKTGQLLGCSYMPAHEIIAWHRHETPDGEFQSVACLDDSAGRPRLWAIVLRRVKGEFQYCLEMLGLRFEGLHDPSWDRYATSEVPRHLDGQLRQQFRARCIPCIPETGMQDGQTALRLKKINAIKARVINCEPFKCVVKSQNTPDARIQPVPAKTASSNRRLGRLDYALEADWPCPLGAGWREDAKLELIFDGPATATVLGISIDLEVASQGGGQI